MCFFMPTPEICAQCPHSNFIYRVKVNIGSQVVYCPRFTKTFGWRNGEQPVYVQMRREACLGQFQRYEFCQECPNCKPGQAPRQTPGWLEAERVEEKRRRKMKPPEPEEVDDGSEG
jgi:hypothetical protein